MNGRLIPPYTGRYEKAVQRLRIRAWYSYVVNSGIDIKSIRLKPRKTESRDTYRRWNHWKNGDSKVEIDDLEAVEKKVPGSQMVYLNGPENVRLWASLSEKSDLKSEQIQSINILPPDEWENLDKSKDQLEKVLERKWVIPKNLCEKYNIPIPKVNSWNSLVISILETRANSIFYDSPIPNQQHMAISNLHEEAYKKWRTSVISNLNDMESELNYYSLSKDDILGLLDTLAKAESTFA